MPDLLLPLGWPDEDDIESAARLYLEYDRKGALTQDVADTFAMAVRDYPAVYKRAAELKAAAEQ